MTDVSKTKDPFAIGIAIASLIAQLGIGLYWGGKIAQRLDDTEHRVDQMSTYLHDNDARVAHNETAIAVITSQLADIKATVDRIDKKTGDRRQ